MKSSRKKLHSRRFEFDKDYWEVCEWWRQHEWPFIPPHALPDNGVMIVDENGVKYAAGWLYVTDSSMGMFEWLVTNPKSPIMYRKAALELMLQCILAAAKNMGLRSVFSSLKNKNLVKLFNKSGFGPTDTQMTNMIARVDL